MPRTIPILFPQASRQLVAMGERLRLARLRRRYSAESVSKRAGIARTTLYRVEEGEPGVSIATYANVLRVLNLQGELDLIARDDVLGRKLQDLNLPIRRRAPRRRLSSKTPTQDESIPSAPEVRSPPIQAQIKS